MAAKSTSRTAKVTTEFLFLGSPITPISIKFFFSSSGTTSYNNADVKAGIRHPEFGWNCWPVSSIGFRKVREHCADLRQIDGREVAVPPGGGERICWAETPFPSSIPARTGSTRRRSEKLIVRPAPRVSSPPSWLRSSKWRCLAELDQRGFVTEIRPPLALSVVVTMAMCPEFRNRRVVHRNAVKPAGTAPKEYTKPVPPGRGGGKRSPAHQRRFPVFCCLHCRIQGSTHGTWQCERKNSCFFLRNMI
jgi:hypothetical protein